MIRGVSLTSPYTQLGILSLPSVTPFFPLNPEVIIANCLSTAGVTLLGYYQLTEAIQLGLQIIQKPLFMKENTIHNFTTTKRALSKAKPIYVHDKRSKLNQPLHTAGHTLSPSNCTHFFPSILKSS